MVTTEGVRPDVFVGKLVVRLVEITVEAGFHVVEALRLDFRTVIPAAPALLKWPGDGLNCHYRGLMAERPSILCQLARR
jgi:hypothetical protein